MAAIMGGTPRTSCDSSDDGDEDLPACPSALLHVRPARVVADVDEEIFLLYTLHAKAEHDGGLGYVNHSADRIFVAIDGQRWNSALSARNLSDAVAVHQDVTSLRSTKGNTGSVLWRSTVELAIRVRTGALFDLAALRDASVLELGAGTGALPALVGPVCKTWLATDQHDLVALLDKNTDALPGVHTAQLDWFDFYNPPSSHTLQIRRSDILNRLHSTTNAHGAVVDLIICCDCIYNPALFPALIATINAFTTPSHTLVLVACEMRSHHSLADFLHEWQASDAAWMILSLEKRFDKGFVTLAAWKS